jgi:hypothetical protein
VGLLELYGAVGTTFDLFFVVTCIVFVLFYFLRNCIFVLS